MKDESFFTVFWDYSKRQLKALRAWLRPVPEDPLYLKIIKGLFKAILLVMLTVFSPVYLLILVIAFFAAF